MVPKGTKSTLRVFEETIKTNCYYHTVTETGPIPGYSFLNSYTKYFCLVTITMSIFRKFLMYVFGTLWYQHSFSLPYFLFIIRKTWKGIKNKSVALQLQRAKTDWSGCCQMAVQGASWLAKRLSLNLNFSFLNRISLLLNQVATQLSSRGWVDPVPDPILPKTFLEYSRESNPGPLDGTKYQINWTFSFRDIIVFEILIC